MYIIERKIDYCLIIDMTQVETSKELKLKE